MQRSIFGEAVKGASHKNNNISCQDAFKIEPLSDTCSIVAVADGHGSSACPYSKYGSEMAVNTFCYIIRRIYDSCEGNLEKVLSYLNQDGEIKVAQAIDLEWKKRVLKAHTRSKRNVPVKDDGKKDKTAIYKQYGTTLLGLFIAPDFVYSFQLGDGDMTLVNKDIIEPIITADKILGVETHSLSKEHSWESSLSSVLRIEAVEKPVVLMVSTDGFSNSYLNDDEYRKACRDYFDLICEHGADVISKHLKAWLDDTSKCGCGDDITTVFVYMQE